MEEQKLISKEPVPTGDVTLGIEFTKEKENPKGVANGTAKLYINDKVVAEGKMRTQPGKFGLCGGLVVGRDGPDAVSKEYKKPFPIKGGQLKQVTINIKGEHYHNLEMEALAMLAKE
jgi:arylsulfatase